MSSASKQALLCTPQHFGVRYEINPWMHIEVQVDHERAVQQWNDLTTIYQQNGITLHLIDAAPTVPDMVFTANAGLVHRNLFIPSNFRYPERQPERELFIPWFRKQGFTIIDMPEQIFFEGAGDALFCGDTLFFGHGFRSDLKAADFLQEVLGVEVVSLKLTSPHFYHLDTCFSPLPSGRFVYYPGAFDEPSRRLLEQAGGYAVSDAFSAGFGCNMTYIDNTIVTSYQDDTIEAIAESEQMNLCVTNITEFRKAGGGVRCLTLFV